MIHTILVPLDGSAFGEHALLMAMHLALRAGADLNLAHVSCANGVGRTLKPVRASGPRHQGARKHLSGNDNRTSPDGKRGQGNLGPDHGSIPEAITKHAQATGADLIILSTHRDTRGERSAVHSWRRVVPEPQDLSRTFPSCSAAFALARGLCYLFRS
jgi:nucleotide-binding universal stress UspA family protein